MKLKIDKKVLIIIGIVLVIIIAIIVGIVVAVDGHKKDIESDRLKTKAVQNAEDVIIDIPKGATPTKIANILEKNNIIKYVDEFIEYTIQTGDDKKLKYGSFALNVRMPYDEIISILKTNGIAKDSVKIVIPEGYELRQILDVLVEKGLGNRENYVDAIKNHNFDYDFLEGLPASETRLEGYLFPATYYFEKNESEIDILNQMLKTFDERFTEEYRTKAKELNMTINEVITFASVVEREAGNDSERGIVASVFYNRLNSKDYPYLESCATVQYILKERKAVLSYDDIAIDSPYNTYKNKGLPPYPIASPGINSIKATLYPDKSDYYFFVLGKDGKHLFAKTYEEHKENMKK